MAAAVEERTIRAQAKWVRCSARKARVVLENIRGQSVPQARTTLAFTPRAAAREVENVLRSAVANAGSHQDFRLEAEDLVVVAAYADEGPTLKRWRPRARGRVNRINKRSCHITVVLAPVEGAVATRQIEEEEATRRRGLRRRAEEAAPEAAVVEPSVEEQAEQEAPAEIEIEEEPVAEEPEEEEPAATEEPVAEAEPEATVAEPQEEEKPRRRRAKKTEEEA